jgi:predicted Na+-dependent transporter
MKAAIDLGIFAIMVLMMMAVGMDLEPRHFRTTAPQKRILVLALVAQFILLPLLGLLLIRVISLPPYASAGILLLTACPNGEIVNYYTWLARANVALAITMSVTSLLLAVMTMPVIFDRIRHKPGGPPERRRCDHHRYGLRGAQRCAGGRGGDHASGKDQWPHQGQE